MALALWALLAFPLPLAAQVRVPAPGPTSLTAYGIPIKRVGSFDTTPIIFRGVRLFTIAAPTNNDPTATPFIVVRQEILESNLRTIVPQDDLSLHPPTSRFDPHTFRVETSTENGYPTIYATDGTRKEIVPILTVTPADATVNGKDAGTLAQSWATILADALTPAIQAVSPEVRAAELRQFLITLGLAILATYLLTLLHRTCRRRVQQLSATSDDAQGTAEGLHLLFRRRLYSTGDWLANVGIVVLWVWMVLFTLDSFSGTRMFATDLRSKLGQIVIAITTIVILNHLVGLLLASATDAWQVNPFVAPDVRARLLKRRPSILAAADNLKNIVAYLLAIAATVSILQLNFESTLTIGAVAAFGVSFAAQSIIKDYVSGWLILVEDQFAIGDIVTIGAVFGTVENMTLRITQLRAEDGRLITIANGTISLVENATRTWARVDLRVAVAVDSDLHAASASLQKALDGLAADPQFAPAVLEPPQVVGVDSITPAGIVLRAWIKVHPSMRAAIMREANARVAEAFLADGIRLAVPQTHVIQTPAAVPPLKE
ncbi:MAG TPA: mechanosensitive ion channel family protein [Candidatus Lustribacter sp.]|nr:mechanosensitive ion channel family protein [Candidatus Lustribacter sp.]